MNFSHKYIAYVLAAASLLGCGQESVVHSGAVLNFETNATYVAIQDGPTGAWQMRLQGNKTNDLTSKSIVLRDPGKRYGLVFVCPGVDDTSAGGLITVKPNVATVFLSTIEELPSVSLLCRQAIAGKIPGKLFGSIKLDTKSDKLGQEYVDIAVGDSVSLRAVEAYATEVTEGSYDVLAMKGVLKSAPGDPNGTDEIEPNAFFVGTANSVVKAPKAADIRFVTEFGSATLVDPSGAQRTTATVSGINTKSADETWVARVGFISQNKGYLLLKEESQQPTFDFVRVPAYRISRDSSGNVITTRTKFIGDRQAHEFSVKVLKKELVEDSEPAKMVDVEQRAYYRFFVDSSSVAVGLPAKPVSAPQVQVSSNATRTVVRAAWPGYTDPVAGGGALYRLETSGVAVPKTVAAGQATPPAKPLVWTSYLTRGWNGSDTFDYTLPDLSAATGWDSNWDFKTNQVISWVQHSYASQSKPGEIGHAGMIIDYLQNNKVVNNLDFAVVHQKGVASPP